MTLLLTLVGCRSAAGVPGPPVADGVDQVVEFLAQALARSPTFDEAGRSTDGSPLRVGILGFSSPDGATVLGDRLAYELSVALANAVGRTDAAGIQIVTRFHLPEILDEQAMAMGDSFAAADIPRVGRLMGADFILTGMLVRESGTVSITAQLLRVSDGVVAGGARGRLELRSGYLDPVPSPVRATSPPRVSHDPGHALAQKHQPVVLAADNYDADSDHPHVDSGGSLLMLHLSHDDLLLGGNDTAVSLLVSVGDNLPHFEPDEVPVGHAGDHPFEERRGLSSLKNPVRQPVHTCLVIDTSGSMSSKNRLVFAVAAANEILDLLNEDDLVSLVSFSGTARVDVDPIGASEAGKRSVRARLEHLYAVGDTNFEEALDLASRCFEAAADRPTVNYMVFISDGAPTAGSQDPVELGDMAHKISELNVSIDTVGVGSGIALEAMDAIARHGNGGFRAVYDDEDLVSFVTGRVRSALAYLGDRAVLRFQPEDGVVILYAGEGWQLHPDGTLSANLGLLHPDERVSRILEVRVLEPLPTRGQMKLGEMTLRYTDRLENMQTESVIVEVGITADPAQYARSTNATVIHEAAFQEARRVLMNAYDLATAGASREASVTLTRLVSYLDGVLAGPEQNSEELVLLVDLADQVRAFSRALWNGDTSDELRESLLLAATRHPSQ